MNDKDWIERELARYRKDEIEAVKRAEKAVG
jgi:hypothetical protein